MEIHITLFVFFDVVLDTSLSCIHYRSFLSHLVNLPALAVAPLSFLIRLRLSKGPCLFLWHT